MGEADPTPRGGLALEREGLRALARSLVQDADAEDVVHDAFATALEQPDVPHKLAPWLRQVVRNNARGRVRRARARELVLLTAVEPEPTEPLEISLDRVRILDALEQALAALDEPYRSTPPRARRLRFVSIVTTSIASTSAAARCLQWAGTAIIIAVTGHPPSGGLNSDLTPRLCPEFTQRTDFPHQLR